MSYIGDCLRKWRDAKKMSQGEVAIQMNCTRGTIHNWETGKVTPSGQHMLELCGVFFEWCN